MDPSEQRTKLTLFSDTAKNKLERLVELYKILRDNDGISTVRRISKKGNRELPKSWIAQLDDLGLVRADFETGTIHLTNLSKNILTKWHQTTVQPVSKSLITAFAETYVGFYDTIAILHVLPVRVSQIKDVLNTRYDLNWESKRQAKQRVDWLVCMGVAEMNAANEYSLTSFGQEVYDDLRAELGTPEVFSIITPDGYSINDTIDEAGDTLSTNDHSNETDPANTPEEENIELPFLEDRSRKVISIHVPKFDGSDDSYKETVESNQTIKLEEAAPKKEYEDKIVRYWSCNRERLERVGDLSRGDVILFHHYDDGYMSCATILDTVDNDFEYTDFDIQIVFEEVCDAAVERDEIFEICDWKEHPGDHWARIDQKEDAAILDHYESIDEFITYAKGDTQFNYWSYENWSIERDFARHLSRQLKRKGQVILYGPPGTGKTFLGETFAEWWTGKQPDTDPTTYQTESVTFHPAFSYEDFIEGYTVISDDSSDSRSESEDTSRDSADGSPYGLKKGVFKEFCLTAAKAKEATPEGRSPPRYVLVIDELNRGNVPQIFGEIITLLERDKRGKQRPLSQSGEEFAIPENVYIIATMNTADQSISKLDAALRRRFAAMSLTPEYDTLYGSHEDFPEKRQDAAELIDTARNDAEGMIAASVLALEIINKKITAVRGLGKGKRIGHAYLYPEVWMTSDDGTSIDTELADVWRYDILPLLEEYFFDDLQQLDRQVFEGDAQFVEEGTNDVPTLTTSDLKENLHAFVMDNQHELDVEFDTE